MKGASASSHWRLICTPEDLLTPLHSLECRQPHLSVPQVPALPPPATPDVTLHGGSLTTIQDVPPRALSGSISLKQYCVGPGLFIPPSHSSQPPSSPTSTCPTPCSAWLQDLQLLGPFRTFRRQLRLQPIQETAQTQAHRCLALKLWQPARPPQQ